MSMQRSFVIRGLKLVFFTLVLVGLVYLLKQDFNGAEFQHLLNSAHLPILFWAFVVFLFTLLLKAMRLAYLSAGLDLPHSLWSCFKIQIVTISFSILTPGRAGEFYKAFLLTEGQAQKLGQGAVVMLVERLLDIFVMALTGLVFAWLVLRHFDVPLIWPSLLVLVALVSGVTALVLLIRHSKALLGFLPQNLQQRLRGGTYDWGRFLPRLFPATLMAAVIWMFEGSIHWLIFKSIDLHLSWPMVVSIAVIVALSSVLSLLPIGLGTVDLSSLFLYGTVLALSHEAIVFEVAASRIVGVGGLFLLLLCVLFLDRELVLGARKHLQKTKPKEN